MEAYKMRIDYNRLFEKLKSENITQKQFREDLKLPGVHFKNLGKINLQLLKL